MNIIFSSNDDYYDNIDDVDYDKYIRDLEVEIINCKIKNYINICSLIT